MVNEAGNITLPECYSKKLLCCADKLTRVNMILVFSGYVNSRKHQEVPSCAGFISVVVSITPVTLITDLKTFEDCFEFVEEETIEQLRPREKQNTE